MTATEYAYEGVQYIRNTNAAFPAFEAARHAAELAIKDEDGAVRTDERKRCTQAACMAACEVCKACTYDDWCSCHERKDGEKHCNLRNSIIIAIENQAYETR